MRKSFLQILGESLPGHIYGIDIYNTLERQEAMRKMEAAEELGGTETAKKALKEKNRRL
ncbi:MAG TPA: hypothetical protein VFK33_01860 [Bacillales bacterium]|nr:hypothetical protein [Bacillales bacterium]